MININNEKIHSLSCSNKVKEALVDYSYKLRDILGDSLVSVCICGSLARDCYHPESSDVDVVVVTHTPCSKKNVSFILDCHREITDISIDAVFVTDNQLHLDEVLAPVEFLVKAMPSGPEGIFSGESRDFLLHRQDVYEAGIALAGEDSEKLFKPVPWKMLSQCLEVIFSNIVTNFKNPELMLCRYAYTHQYKKLCSKQTAGRWAMKYFDADWHSMIQKAILDYSAGLMSDTDMKRLKCFEKYCGEYVQLLK